MGDLGILVDSRPDRHETFRKHYPDGYRMDFVTHKEVDNHPGLQEAFRLNKLKAENEELTDEDKDSNVKIDVKVGADAPS